MEKSIFWANFIKNFFRRSAPQKIFDKLCKKMVFIIFKANLDFNYLYPFLYFKLNICQNFELWKKNKCAQTLVIYSRVNIRLFMKKF